MNINKTPALIFLAVLSFLLWLVFASLDDIEAEPNESISWATAEKEVLWYYDGKTTHRYSLDKPEPNEPKCNHELLYFNFCSLCEFGSCDCNICKHCGKDISEINTEPEPKKYSLPIPTWPEYIELEKDLMYFVPDDNEVCTVGDGIECIMMPKGTKIYFKGGKRR